MESLFKEGRKSVGGYHRYAPETSIYGLFDKQREDHYDHLWKAGSFSFGAQNYKEILLDVKANRMAYDFWAKKTRARLSDAKKRDILAPIEPPYLILTKRCPLEQDYYEMLDRDNVELIDLNATPIKTFTQTGIRPSDDQEREHDYVVLASASKVLPARKSACSLLPSRADFLLEFPR
ncbi:hypothetical protein LTR10_024214 [Elasticomyces elasticus]|uniref:Uncharacterized protein n=1 Tax=Exophiala sideris TaxID=1016849 RepID=A0ABR0IW05_9EURO|nr:hypothetical protein LTR10_024214 [Elasticomyces elasticus]KAK5020755.1 hypothetical protein LTS07_011453 [Exophiala sideris]KAK5022861.1 hypothetical protein LTR13_011385 [Exophiala sideris]KAK5048109.1 hypothetical protein LTR69_011453 [Exophiala sideris]KAK5176002.1 hypothetical protein LTR44_011441 [Eurotiomycetes sp. CCFEE 6388]